MLKRGKDGQKIRTIIGRLLREEPLEIKHSDHKLVGNWKDRRDCHIEPDWVLIYKPVPSEGLIIFERTGTHSDLFR